MFPTAIRKTLASSSLLLVGDTLSDINFCILLKALNSLGETKKIMSNIILQLPFVFSQEKKERGQRYMENCIRQVFNCIVYWGIAKNC